MRNRKIWKDHVFKYPKIKTWPLKKQLTAKKAYIAGYRDAELKLRCSMLCKKWNVDKCSHFRATRQICQACDNWELIED